MYCRRSYLSVLLLLVCVSAHGQDGASSLEYVSLPRQLSQIDSSNMNGREIPDWIIPVSSALIPGTGQLLSGHDRGILYLAAEVFLALRLWSVESEGRRERDAYVDLAFSVARAPFRPSQRDTVFEYYEAMQSYIESGPFSTSSGSVPIPPSDESTYNGHIWRLAKETFLPDPDVPADTASDEYGRAMDFYASRAIGPNFQWSWRDAGLERDLFAQSIRSSDDAFRSATQYLGLILVNHLVSTIDAFVSQRLGSRASITSAVAAGPDRGRDVVARVMLRVEF